MNDLFQILILLLAAAAVVLLCVLLLKNAKERDRSEEAEALRKELASFKAEQVKEARADREEINRAMAEVQRTIYGMNDAQLRQLAELTKRNGDSAEGLRLTIDEKLGEMRRVNEGKLEEMRRTVDEKLEDTLNRRLGESFGLVNDRLEKVNKSLGEIRGLSVELTDIKKLFSNVKTRGVWGEVQLAQILEEILTPEQYVTNFAAGKNTSERVEFAVVLPGRDEAHSKVYLPIDSKFPAEDYRRLTEAAEAGDTVAMAECRKSLERTLKNEAKMIRDKYVNPPRTLDYGILFLPTEGLFSEALRLPSFMEYATEQRIMVTGPTNLAALLNSLKMGFKTLAIEEKSGEIRKLLATVKTDMAKFAASLEKAQRKLGEAEKTLDEATHRTELITKRLKTVETAETAVSAPSEPEND